jgi:aminopeptidase N
LRKGRDFTVIVRYAGVPEVITDPDESIEGWVPTADGAFVVGEPQGAPGWFPSNDNPQDKATFDEAITVPDGITALGNGVLAARFSHGGRTTWVWHESDPMATYLATATNGHFALTQTHVGAIPVYNAVDPTLSAELGPLLDEVPDIVRFFSALYGPYPFNAAGAIVDDAPDVGYALESQTKPNFAFVPDETTLVHELAHQWFGDAVTLRRWPDIWLHEGFAEWSEWIWSERHGGPSAQDFFDDLVAENDPGTWDPAPGLVTDAPDLFSNSVYDRGAMTLQALRVEVGDATFLRILRDWFAQHKYANATTADFIALAQRDSRRDLRGFFQKWLYTPGPVVTAPAATAARQPAVAQLAAGQRRRR